MRITTGRSLLRLLTAPDERFQIFLLAFITADGPKINAVDLSMALIVSDVCYILD